MDTKTIIVTLVCAVLGSSALTAVVNAVVSAVMWLLQTEQRSSAYLQRVPVRILLLRWIRRSTKEVAV